MKNLFLLLLLLAFPLAAQDTKTTALPDGTATVTDDDEIPVADDPAGTPTSKKVSVGDVRAHPIEDLSNVSSASPNVGDVQKWTGTEYAPAVDQGAGTGEQYCSMDKIRCAHLEVGATINAKIQACIDNLESANGGDCDARGISPGNIGPLTVKEGVHLQLGNGVWVVDGRIWVEQGARLSGTTQSDNQGNSPATDDGTTLKRGAVATEVILAANRDYPDQTKWWHYGEIKELRVQANGIVGIRADQMGENNRIHRVHVQAASVGIKIGSVSLYPNSQAGASSLVDLAIMGSSVCALEIEHMSGEWLVNGLSGDDNQKFVCMSSGNFGSVSAMFMNIKTETFQAGRNNPIFDITNTNANFNLLVINSRHTCGAGGCGEYFKIDANTAAGVGVRITTMNTQYAGGSNFVNDLTNSKVISDLASDPHFFHYDSINGNVRADGVYVARGLLRAMNDDGTSVGACTSAVYGTQYYSDAEADEEMCVCVNDDTDDAWVKMSAAGPTEQHAAHCANQ